MCALLEASDSSISVAERTTVFLPGLPSEFDAVVSSATLSSTSLPFQRLVDALIECENRQVQAAKEVVYAANIKWKTRHRLWMFHHVGDVRWCVAVVGAFGLGFSVRSTQGSVTLLNGAISGTIMKTHLRCNFRRRLLLLLGFVAGLHSKIQGLEFLMLVKI